MRRGCQSAFGMMVRLDETGIEAVMFLNLEIKMQSMRVLWKPKAALLYEQVDGLSVGE
jgi:hypothetical protein